jgi:hypothetical protein
LHPTSGNLWVGAGNTPLVAELNPTTGALVRTVDLTPFGIGSEITGLAFDDASTPNLLVSSHRTGVVYSLDLTAPSPSPIAAPPMVVDEALHHVMADNRAIDENVVDAVVGRRSVIAIRRLAPETVDAVILRQEALVERFAEPVSLRAARRVRRPAAARGDQAAERLL